MLGGEGGVANGGGMEEAGGGGGGGRRVEMVEVANSCGHSSDHHRYDQGASTLLGLAKAPPLDMMDGRGHISSHHRFKE
ncbi:hypothetical protein Tco_0069197 [Tanacetum coccineum]